MANNSKRSGSFIKRKRESGSKLTRVIDIKNLVRRGNKVRSRVLRHIQTTIKRSLKGIVRNLTDKVRRAKRKLVININSEKITLLRRNKPIGSYLKRTRLVLYDEIISVIRPDSRRRNNKLTRAVFANEVQTISRAKRISRRIRATIGTSCNQISAIRGNNPDERVYIITNDTLIERNLPLISNIKKVVSGVVCKVAAAGIQPTIGAKNNSVVLVLGKKRRGQTEMQKVVLRQDYFVINRGNVENVRIRIGKNVIAASIETTIRTLTGVVPLITGHFGFFRKRHSELAIRTNIQAVSRIGRNKQRSNAAVGNIPGSKRNLAFACTQNVGIIIGKNIPAADIETLISSVCQIVTCLRGNTNTGNSQLPIRTNMQNITLLRRNKTGKNIAIHKVSGGKNNLAVSISMENVYAGVRQNIRRTNIEITVIPVPEVIEPIFGNFRNDRSLYKQFPIRVELNGIAISVRPDVADSNTKSVIADFENVPFRFDNRHRRRSKLVAFLRRLVRFLIIEKNRIKITHGIS
uniref:Uncharacterized protein n=1 Tax=Podoviridae sp. ct2iq11 TaxID=2827720 RepID=A0A8S5TPJ0_9CAUD|nr:MAG TPA: hypothetical protein [Podoviridae sp. ct2iq11]